MNRQKEPESGVRSTTERMALPGVMEPSDHTAFSTGLMSAFVFDDTYFTGAQFFRLTGYEEGDAGITRLDPLHVAMH